MVSLDLLEALLEALLEDLLEDLLEAPSEDPSEDPDPDPSLSRCLKINALFGLTTGIGGSGITCPSGA